MKHQKETILSIQPRDVGGGDAKSPDDIIKDLIKVIKGKIPHNIKLDFDVD